MRQVFRVECTVMVAVAAVAVSLGGCTSFRDYVHQGLKVGPNYCRPAAPVAEHWIETADIRQPPDTESLRHWWTVFNDPKLNYLVACAYRQNLTLREAGMRVLEARAQLAIARGDFFPQTQNATGSYSRNGASLNPPNGGGGFGGARFTDQWNMGFNLNWELDFWGRFRRAIASADDRLDASVEGYDGALVTLLGDVATNYVLVRTDQERIKLLKANAELQQGIVKFIQDRFDAGFRQTELDLDQAVSNLKQTEAQIPPLEIDCRIAEDQLCILLGMPPVNLAPLLGDGPIPAAPVEVAIGIPADLLRRRPDVRQAERLAAAQAEQIGIAEADLYPALSLNGTFGYQAGTFASMFTSDAFHGSFGPSFQWNVLNYGRIVNNVRYNDALFQELAITYQNSVLTASAEVEDGLITFLRSQEQAKLLDESVVAAVKAVKIVVAQYNAGAVDFNRYALIEQNLVTQQDQWTQARGRIAQGLIVVYRALGGGWEIRLDNQAAMSLPPDMPPPEAKPVEEVPVPPANVPEAPQRLPAAPTTIPPPPTDVPVVPPVKP